MTARAVPSAPGWWFGTAVWVGGAVLMVATLLSGCGPASADAELAAGNASAAKGDHPAAVVAFTRAVHELQGEPELAKAQFLLGQALLDNGDAPAAVATLSQALDGGVSAAEAVPALAQALWLTGQYRKLAALYGELVFADDPYATASLKTSVAAAWAALADAGEARAAIEAALAARPRYARAQVLQAAIVAGHGDLDSAGHQLDTVLAAEPRLASAWMLRGEIAWQQGRPADATAAFRKALAAQPALMPARLAQVDLALLATDGAAARAALQAMQERQPLHPLTRYAQAQLACFDGDYARARDLTQDLLRSAPNHPGVLLLSAVAEAHIGSLVIADSRLAKALQIEPQSVPVRLDLAQVQLLRRQAAPALRTLAPLLESEADAPAAAWSLAGAAEGQLGHSATALQRLQQAAAAEPANAAYATEAVLARLVPGSEDEQTAVIGELQALSNASQAPQPDRALVQLQLQRRDYPGAAAALKTLARKQPRAADVAVWRARVAMARDDPRQSDRSAARAALQQALQIDPASFAAAAALARLDLLEGQPQAARQRLQASVAAVPGNTAARLALAAFDIRAGAPFAGVSSILSAAIQRDPTATAPRLMRIELLLAHHETRRALDLAQQSEAALPDEPALLEATGRAQLAGGALEQAVYTFSHLVALAPAQSTPQQMLGDALRLSGQSEAAATAYRNAIQIDPHAQAARLGLMQLLRTTATHPRELIELAQQRQQVAPTDGAAYLAEAEAWLSLKDDAAAGAAYQRGSAVVADAPRHARAWFAALRRHGRAAAARQFGERWLAVHSEDSAIEFDLATAAIARRDWPQAEARLQSVVARHPDDGTALNNLAWAQLMQSKPGALQTAQRAADRLPGQTAVLDTLALALAAGDQPDQALITQQAALRLDPADNRLRLGLAQVALRAGDKPLARRELQHLKRLGSAFAGQADVARLWQQL